MVGCWILKDIRNREIGLTLGSPNLLGYRVGNWGISGVKGWTVGPATLFQCDSPMEKPEGVNTPKKKNCNRAVD